MRLRWKLDAPETGLRRIVARPRTSWLHDGEKRYACVSEVRQTHQTTWWYWVAGWDSDVPHMNTCSHPVATADEAKQAAMAYVRQHI